MNIWNDLAAFTVAGWINSAGPQANRTGLFGQNNMVEFGFNTATIHCMSIPSKVPWITPDRIRSTNGIIVAATGSSNQVAIFVDGNMVASKSVANSTFTASRDIFSTSAAAAFLTRRTTGFSARLTRWRSGIRALSTNEIASLVSSNAPQISYTNYINTDVKAQMYGSNATAYVRIPFNVTNPAAVASLQLLMRYDDGFVAYLNGHQIASANAPGTLAWNSAATQRHPDSAAVQWTPFNVTAALPYLQAGGNVLTIQALNINATNTDFLMQAQLVAQSIADVGHELEIFHAADAGRAEWNFGGGSGTNYHQRVSFSKCSDQHRSTGRSPRRSRRRSMPFPMSR